MTKEDFEDEQLTPAVIAEEPPQLTHQQRAHRLAESVLAQPLDDDQATALAGVYATLALVDAVTQALERLGGTAEDVARGIRTLEALDKPKPAQRRTAAPKSTATKGTK